MEVKTIVKEIQRLPLSKRFFVMEQTLKSIKKEELSIQTEKAVNLLHDENTKDIELIEISHLISEKSLAKDWFSEEDNRWDKVL
ncbi:MAG: hypothetical protein EAZ53_01450 [Bacteroidetes bacterium]|nr:MAG: hypothetical protein EAZ53_01450 [Bacteroidota bacterium]